VSSTIYLEGGGDARDLNIRCREGFRRLLEKCGYRGQMPRLVAGGGRDAAFDAFNTALTQTNKRDFVGLWIDSEDPLDDINAAWDHLAIRDRWTKPTDATDEQVLFMATCMETLIVADRETLADFYGSELQESALPALNNLESRARDVIQNALTRATRNCSNAYAKGKRSFEVLGCLDPATLVKHLPSFVRVRRILGKVLME